MTSEACRWFESSDGRVAVAVTERSLQDMATLSSASPGTETGGVLVGYYTDCHGVAKILEATGPPVDSRFGTNWFHRGVSGLRTFLAELWGTRRHYYLGEWHFHPFASSAASNVDVAQMREIAATAAYRCPEPILAILGGDPSGKWTLSVFVFIGRKSVLQLIERK